MVGSLPLVTASLLNLAYVDAVGGQFDCGERIGIGGAWGY
jgi:hypothetical protein